MGRAPAVVTASLVALVAAGGIWLAVGGGPGKSRIGMNGPLAEDAVGGGESAPNESPDGTGHGPDAPTGEVPGSTDTYPAPGGNRQHTEAGSPEPGVAVAKGSESGVGILGGDRDTGTGGRPTGLVDLDHEAKMAGSGAPEPSEGTGPKEAAVPDPSIEPELAPEELARLADEAVLAIATDAWNGKGVVKSIENSPLPKAALAQSAWRLLSRLVAATTGDGPQVGELDLGSGVSHTLTWLAARLPAADAETLLVQPTVARIASGPVTGSVEYVRHAQIRDLAAVVPASMALGLADTVKLGVLARWIEMNGECPPKLLSAVREAMSGDDSRTSARRLAAEPVLSCLAEWMEDRSRQEDGEGSDLEPGMPNGMVAFLEVMAGMPGGDPSGEEVDDEWQVEEFSDHILIPDSGQWSARLVEVLKLLHLTLRRDTGGAGGGGLRYLRSKTPPPPRAEALFTEPERWIEVFISRTRHFAESSQPAEALDKARAELGRDLHWTKPTVDFVRLAAARGLSDFVGRERGSLEADAGLWMLVTLHHNLSGRPDSEFSGAGDPKRILLDLSDRHTAGEFGRMVSGVWRDSARHREEVHAGLKLLLRSMGEPEDRIHGLFECLRRIGTKALTVNQTRNLLDSFGADLGELAPRASSARKSEMYGQILLWIESSIPVPQARPLVPSEGTPGSGAGSRSDTDRSIWWLSVLSKGARPTQFHGGPSRSLWQKLLNHASNQRGSGDIRTERMRLLYAGWEV